MKIRTLDPVSLRGYIGDGNYGGLYQRSDDDVLAIWQIAVEETRALLNNSLGRRGVVRCPRLGSGSHRRHIGRVPSRGLVTT